jgi:Holliday junction resolvase
MPINSKRKGVLGEREFARLCRDEGFDSSKRGQQFHGGEDSPDVIGLPSIHVEVKRREDVSLVASMAQSSREKGERELPIVAHRKNRQRWMITMYADDWFKIYREALAANPEDGIPF